MGRAVAPRCGLRRAATVAWLGFAVSLVAAQPVIRPGGSPDWRALTPAQQSALAPLQSQWAQLDDARRDKWLDVAGKFASMPDDERARVQARMADWSHLSPAERGRARVQFQEAQRWSPSARQTRWEEYQSLHPEARRVLSERWRLEAAARASKRPAPSSAKRNVVEAPLAPASPSQPASPITVRAQAGATSTLVSAQPAFRGAIHTGVPKVATTDAFVDPVTLLPRRGPQAAGVVTPPKPAKKER